MRSIFKNVANELITQLTPEDLKEAEKTILQTNNEEIIHVQKSLPFEIVDYAIEYIGFKNHVR